jgi:phosphoribosylglycinamide formyltransferase-1
MLTRAPLPRVALLCSRRCPGLRSLVSGHRRRVFDLVCCLATDDGFGAQAELDAARIPLLTHPIRPFYASRGRPVGDLSLRPDYDRLTAELLAPHRPDVLLLSSYLYLLTRPVLDAYPGRIVNVHAGDLSRTGPDGRPLYPGLRAVRDAIRAGEVETRATAHVVTERLDEGPILLRSSPFPVSPLVADLRRLGNLHALNAYSFAHQEWMLATAWGPLLLGAVPLVAGRPREASVPATRDGLPGRPPMAAGGRP